EVVEHGTSEDTRFFRFASREEIPVGRVLRDVIFAPTESANVQPHDVEPASLQTPDALSFHLSTVSMTPHELGARFFDALRRGCRDHHSDFRSTKTRKTGNSHFP